MGPHGHNPTASGPTGLTLSAVGPGADRPHNRAGDPSTPGDRPDIVGGRGATFVRPHVHDARLCAPCMAARFATLNPRPRRRGRHSADLIAQTIRLHGGSVWPAVVEYGVSYRHACRIRAGWRPGGRRAIPVPYVSRGWIDGERGGSWTEAELREAWGR